MKEEPTIGSRIRDRRKELGIAQHDLSEIAGISVHTLSDIESGKGNPTIATLDRILRPLGLELSVSVRGVGSVQGERGPGAAGDAPDGTRERVRSPEPKSK